MIIFDERGWEVTWFKGEYGWTCKWSILYMYLCRVFPEEVAKKVVRDLVKYEDYCFLDAECHFPMPYDAGDNKKKLSMAIRYIGSSRGIRSNRYAVSAASWGIKDIQKEEVTIKDKIEDIKLLSHRIISICVNYP
jgi:hypothetical protein